MNTNPIRSDIDTRIGIVAAWRIHEDETTYKYKMGPRGKGWVVDDVKMRVCYEPVR